MDQKTVEANKRDARSLFWWSGVSQFVAFGCYVMGMIAAASGDTLVVTGISILIVIALLTSITLAYVAGTYWPMGGDHNAR